MSTPTQPSHWSPHPLGAPEETPAQRTARRARQRRLDHTILTAGGTTGWWDESGQPAPWPEDFFDHDTDWRPTSHTPPEPAPGEQPF